MEIEVRIHLATKLKSSKIKLITKKETARFKLSKSKVNWILKQNCIVESINIKIELSY